MNQKFQTSVWFSLWLLGLLHLEIVQERLEREFDMDLITTAPTVVYQVLDKTGEIFTVENPAKLPDPTRQFRKFVNQLLPLIFWCRNDHVGAVITLCTQNAECK